MARGGTSPRDLIAMNASRCKNRLLGLIACLLTLGVIVLAMRWCVQSRSVQLELMDKKVDVIFFRNFRVPTFDFRYKKLPKEYQLGKAVVIPPSAAWQKLASQLGIKRDVSEFPLAFAQTRRSKGGRELLVVAQLAHKFSGEGFFSGPGPEILMEMVTVEGYGTAAPNLVWSGSTHLGTMQGSCLYAGIPDAGNPSKVTFNIDTEGGYSKTVTMELLDNGSLQVMQKP